MTDSVLPLNYCAHAIEDLRAQVLSLQNHAPASAYFLGRIVNMLRNSIKFIFANCCELIDPDELKQSHLDLIHLPYPRVAFEAPWYNEEPCTKIGEFAQIPSTKRIALCWRRARATKLSQVLTKF